MAETQNLPRVNREQHQYFVSPDIPSVLEVDPGQEFIVETMDCFSCLIEDDSQKFDSINDLTKLVPGLNPVSGPISVNGAVPGDILAIHIIDMKIGVIGDRAVGMVIPDFGGLCNPHTLVQELGPDTKICKIHETSLDFPLKDRTIKLPIKPMIGTIWTAPRFEKRYSYVHDHVNGGNMDCQELGPGHTIFLPVQAKGGLISMGDVHACMGDAEITGIAMETSADIQLKVDIIKEKDSRYIGYPQLESERTIGSVGCQFGRPIGDNIKLAFKDLITRMHKFYGFEIIDAYQLLGQIAEVTVHQTLDNWTSAMVKIDKKYLQP